MFTSEGLAELKYQEILEYQDVVADTAIGTIHAQISNNQMTCLGMALIISLLMGCCALVFMPGTKHKQQR